MSRRSIEETSLLRRDGHPPQTLITPAHGKCPVPRTDVFLSPNSPASQCHRTEWVQGQYGKTGLQKADSSQIQSVGNVLRASRQLPFIRLRKGKTTAFRNSKLPSLNEVNLEAKPDKLQCYLSRLPNAFPHFTSWNSLFDTIAEYRFVSQTS